VNIDEAFEQWLDEPFFDQKSRRTFVVKRGTNLEHLRWAFGGGWVLGQQRARKELQNV
jgi:hypothetical protein